MRYPATLLLILVLAGCTTSRTTIPGGEETRLLDFTKYAAEGFLITPERYDGEYDALGQIYVSHYPEAKRGSRQSTYAAKPVYTDWRITTEVSAQDAVDDLYDAALNLGADAVMNFDLSFPPHPYGPFGPTEPKDSDMTSIRVSGFAIKRR